MVYAPVRSIIISLKLGDYLSVQRTSHALSLTCVISQVGISVEVRGPGRRILSRVNDHVFMTKTNHEV